MFHEQYNFSSPKIHRDKKIHEAVFVSDHDFQTALMEALCRMTNPAQRKEFADKWFSMEHVANAFVRLRDTEFETVTSCPSPSLLFLICIITLF